MEKIFITESLCAPETETVVQISYTVTPVTSSSSVSPVHSSTAEHCAAPRHTRTHRHARRVHTHTRVHTDTHRRVHTHTRADTHRRVHTQTHTPCLQCEQRNIPQRTQLPLQLYCSSEFPAIEPR